MITVKTIDENNFEVTVKDATKTSHRVSLSNDYYQQLTDGKISKEELMEKSFAFLLERESNTMIYRTFDLPVIETYFPEYKNEIKNQIGAN